MNEKYLKVALVVKVFWINKKNVRTSRRVGEAAYQRLTGYGPVSGYAAGRRGELEKVGSVDLPWEPSQKPKGPML